MFAFSRRSMFGAVLVGVAGLVGLARCSTASTPTAYACPAPAILRQAAALLYPIPRSTGVPITPGNLIFSNAPPSGFGSFLTLNGTIVAVTSTFAPAPSPLPSPYATPVYSPTGSLVAAPYPKLSPGATYEVTFAGSGGLFEPPCGSGYETDYFTTAAS